MNWEELKKLAAANNIAPGDIGDKIGVSHASVSKWFNGEGIKRSSEAKCKKVEKAIKQIIADREKTPIPVASSTQMPMPTMVSLNVARVNGLLTKHGFTWQNLAFLLGNENFTETNLTTDNTVSQQVIEKIADIFKISASELCISEEKLKNDLYTKMDVRLDEINEKTKAIEAKIDSLNEKFLNLVKVITNMEDAVIETYVIAKELKGGTNAK